MEKEDKIRLVKCSNCNKAFYIKTKSKGEIKLICPYCEDEVTIKINGDRENDSS